MNEITYTRQGDYLLPDLTMPEQPELSMGRYARMRKKFLKEHHKVRYYNLLTSCALNEHLNDTERRANEMEQMLTEQMAASEGVTENLKATDMMSWVRKIEHSCESPYIQGWKLEMMAEQVFDRYIENADKVMDLSYAMLEKHIADQEELPDNTDVIQRKQGEIEKLMNKRTNLIEMRAEGDIDKEMFRSKKQEIEDRVAKLTEEIKGLQPEKEQTSNEDYSVKLLELRERLKEYTGFDYSVIPESIVEAFIERIWVSKDEFRWYLRTGNNAEGEFDPDDHIKIGAFTLTIDDAKKYIYSFSTRRRVYKWADLNVSVWI